MVISFKRPKDIDMLFWIPYGLYLISEIFFLSLYSKYIPGAARYAIYFCVIVILVFRELFIQGYSIKSFLRGILLILLALFTSIQTSVFTVAFILIFLFCARNLNFDDIARFSLWVISITLIFIVLSGYLGIIDNYTFMSSTRTRHYLGFRYALYPAALLFDVIALALYLKRDQTKWTQLIFWTLISFWMFRQTDSRLSFYVSMILIVLLGILKIAPNFFKKKRVICILMVFSFVICMISALYFTITYNSSVQWQRQLNSWLGNRLSLGQTSLVTNGVTIWGQEFNQIGNGLDAYGNTRVIESYSYVDSYYVQLVQRYGIIFSLIWLIILTYTMYRCYKMQNYYLLVCLSIIAIRLMIDDTFGKLYYNTFWFTAIIFLKDPRKSPKEYTLDGS